MKGVCPFLISLLIYQITSVTSWLCLVYGSDLFLTWNKFHCFICSDLSTLMLCTHCMCRNADFLTWRSSCWYCTDSLFYYIIKTKYGEMMNSKNIKRAHLILLCKNIALGVLQVHLVISLYHQQFILISYSCLE